MVRPRWKNATQALTPVRTTLHPTTESSVLTSLVTSSIRLMLGLDHTIVHILCDFFIYKIHKPHKQIANEKQNAGNFTGQTEVICFKEVMLSFVFLLPNVFSANKRAFVASGFIPNFTFCILSWKRKCTLDTSAFLFSSPEAENHGGLVVICLFRFFVCFYPHLPEIWGEDFKLSQKAVKEAFGPTTQTQCFVKIRLRFRLH